MSSLAVDPQADCRLFLLPAEIRNDIYTLALTVAPSVDDEYAENGIEKSVPLTTSPEHPERPSVLALLQTCRLVHDEACGIFYSTQRLHLVIRYGDSIAQMTRSLSACRLQAFREFKVTVRSLEAVTLAIKTLRRLSSLHVARINIHPYPVLGFDSPLPREKRFLERACAKLPGSLKHVYLTLEWRYGWAYRVLSLTREELAMILWKTGRHDSESSERTAGLEYACLWCGPAPRIEKEETIVARPLRSEI